MKNTLKKFSLIKFSLNRQKVRWELCIYYIIYTFSDLCFQIKIDFKVTKRPMVQVIWVFQKWFLILIETLQQRCLQYSINLSFNSDNQLFSEKWGFPSSNYQQKFIFSDIFIFPMILLHFYRGGEHIAIKTADGFQYGITTRGNHWY